MSHKHRKSRRQSSGEQGAPHSESSPEGATGPAMLARVDGPHLQRIPEGSLAATPPSAAAGSAARAEALPVAPMQESESADASSQGGPWPGTSQREQMQLQAEQIGEYLQTREAELDRREALLHAEAARLESQMRSSRLSLRERQQTLLDREEELERRETEFARHQQSLSAQLEESRRQLAMDQQTLAAEQIALNRRLYQCEVRAQSLQRQETALSAAQCEVESKRQSLENDARRQQQQIESQRAASAELVRKMRADLERRRASLECDAESRAQEPQPQLASQPIAPEKLAELERLEQALADRTRDWEERDLQQHAAEAEIAEARRQLERRREAFFALEREQKLSWTEHLRQDEVRLQRRKQALDRLSETLDARRLALEQAREEINLLHRDSLEMRLLTEELWTRLGKAVPPAQLTQSLAGLRGQLAERCRLERAELERTKRDLLEIGCRVGGERQRLSEQRRELQDWLASQQACLDERAAELMSKDELLRCQAIELEQMSESWRAQKLVLQREIRRLQSMTRHAGLAVA